MTLQQIITALTTWFLKNFKPFQHITENVVADALPPLPVEPVPPVQPPTPPIPVVVPPPPVAAPKYLWDTKENIRHSMRVIGDELGLSVLQKDLLCDICACESGFNLKAKLVNNPHSIDRGLFQINSLYHLEATDEKAYDPDWSTRWACRAILNKQIHALWSASEHCWNKSGKYNRLLGR